MANQHLIVTGQVSTSPRSRKKTFRTWRQAEKHSAPHTSWIYISGNSSCSTWTALEVQLVAVFSLLNVVLTQRVSRAKSVDYFATMSNLLKENQSPEEPLSLIVKELIQMKWVIDQVLPLKPRHFKLWMWSIIVNPLLVSFRRLQIFWLKGGGKWGYFQAIE